MVAQSLSFLETVHRQYKIQIQSREIIVRTTYQNAPMPLEDLLLLMKMAFNELTLNPSCEIGGKNEKGEVES